MSLVIPNAAEEAHLRRILDPDMELKLFTNDVIDGLTAEQVEALDETDFTEATFSGYAAVPIAGENQGVSSDWTITPEDPTEAVAPQQTFESDADQTPETVYGYYVVRDYDGGLEWFEYLTSPQVVENNNDTIKVTPRFTYRDETD